MVHYGFSKSAQLVIARGAAETTKGTNVTVNSVMPGPTWVEMAPVRLAARAEAAGTTVDDLVQRTFTEAPPGVAAAALRQAGRGRQSDLLRLLKSLQRHQRRRAPRRRRDCHEPVLMTSVLTSPRLRGEVGARIRVSSSATARGETSPRGAALARKSRGAKTERSHAFFVELVSDQRWRWHRPRPAPRGRSRRP